MPRYTHQKLVPHFFPILTPRSRSPSSLSAQSPISYPISSWYKRRTMLCAVYGDLVLRIFCHFCLHLAILSCSLTSVTRTSHGASRIAGIHPDSCRNNFFLTLLPGEKKKPVLPIILLSATYPRTRNIHPFVHTTSQDS